METDTTGTTQVVDVSAVDNVVSAGVVVVSAAVVVVSQQKHQ